MSEKSDPETNPPDTASGGAPEPPDTTGADGTDTDGTPAEKPTG